MLTLDQMKALKQKNVCTDSELAKLRFSEDFKAAKNTDKKRIVEMSGQKRQSFYRVFRTGSAGARLVVAMAYVLGVSPFYYTCELDEREPFSEETLNAFLIQNGYEEMAQENAKPVRRRRERKHADAPIAGEAEAAAEHDEPAEEETAEQSGDTLVVKLTFENSPEMQKAIEELSFEQATMLLQALFLRGEAGGTAKQYANIVKLCLLA